MEDAGAYRTRVREIIAVELQVQAEHVRSGVSLRRDLGMDSVAALNILFAAEETLGVHIPETELEDVDDLDAVVMLIERHLPRSAMGTIVACPGS